MASVLDVVDNYLGEAVGPNDESVWTALTTAQRTELYEETLKFLRSFDARSLLGTSKEPVAALDLSAEWIRRPEHIPDIVTTTLLYFPRIALVWPRLSGEATPWLLRRLYHPYLLLRPLVEGRIVLSAQLQYTEHHHRDAHKVIDYMNELPEFLEVVGALRERVFAETDMSWFPDTVNFFSDAQLASHYGYYMLLRFGESISAGLDPLPQGYAEWRTIHTILDLMQQRLASRTAVSYRYGSIVRRVTLPRCLGIGSPEIVALRQSEECFALWRACLTDAINSIDVADDTSVDGFPESVSESLKERALLVEESVLRTRLADRFKRGVVGFSLSAVTFSVASALGVGQIVQEATKWGISAAVAALWGLCLGRPSPSRRALRRHFAAFLRDDEGRS